MPTKELRITIDRDIAIPLCPNFIRFRMRKDSKDFNGTVPISDLTDEELRVIGQAWTNNLIDRAKEIREAGL